MSCNQEGIIWPDMAPLLWAVQEWLDQVGADCCPGRTHTPWRKRCHPAQWALRQPIGLPQFVKEAKVEGEDKKDVEEGNALVRHLRQQLRKVWVWAVRHTPHFAVDWGGERDLRSLPVKTVRLLCPPQSAVIKSRMPCPGLDCQVCCSIVQVPKEESHLQRYKKKRILPDFNNDSYLHWFWRGPLTTDKNKPWDRTQCAACSHLRWAWHRYFCDSTNSRETKCLICTNIYWLETSEFLKGLWDFHHCRTGKGK